LENSTRSDHGYSKKYQEFLQAGAVVLMVSIDWLDSFYDSKGEHLPPKSDFRYLADAWKEIREQSECNSRRA
jgi:peroxiredoxin